MKKLILLLIAFVASIEIAHAGVQGALPGAFSVSATKKVYFSQGNLQYQASTKTWRFAAYQYTRIGATGNNNMSATYSGWIDWFAWGTGSNPISTSSSSSFTDWGVNKISNGGNQANLWRTLTKAEWEYLFSGRANAANRRSTATVNNVVGYIFLPDSWTLPSGLKFVADVWCKWNTNKYSLEDWKKMEQNGAIFLPKTASISKDSSTGKLTYSDSGWFSDEYCHYWSSTQESSSNAHLFSSYIVGYYSTCEVSISSAQKSRRHGVRLVIDSDKNTSYTITWKNWDGTTLATTSVLKGATPSYTGATPTRPSTAEYAYTFSGWTPAITAATANKTYTATYTATPRYTITFNANGGLIPTGGNMGNTPSGHITTLSTDRTSGTVVVTKDKSYFQTMTNDCPSREGYTFAGWYTDPTSGVQVYDNTGYRVVGTYWNNEGNWIGTSNVTLYAHWTPIPYTITVNSSNVSQGTAAGGGTYDYGTNHQITATSNECYQFTQWSDGNTDNPRTIIVNGDATYTAEFSSMQYTIKVESADESQGTVGVELVSTEGKEKDRIYYTSSDGNIVTPYSATVFGANIVSNTCQDGQGVIIFDRPVVSIGVEAFYRCKALASIVIPNGVTSIGKSTFIECISLTSVTIPNSVISIGIGAFEECHSLTSVTIPNSVTSIEADAFWGCESLTSIVIPNGVTRIGQGAFYGCYKLTSVTIGNSVTSIGDEAFRSCFSLTSVTFEGLTPPTIGKYVFDNTNNCPIYIPYGTKDAYVAALNVNNTIDASRVIEK